MPEDLRSCHPSEWLQRIQDSKFFLNFQSDQARMEIDIDIGFYENLKVLATNETEKLGLNISLNTALNVIFYEHLYGTPSCRVMFDLRTGLFSMRARTAYREIAKNDSVKIKLSLPEMMLQDLICLTKNHPQKPDPIKYCTNIIDKYFNGYIKPSTELKTKDDGENPKLRYSHRDIKTTFGFSTPLKYYVSNEAKQTDSEMSQIFLDIVSETMFGYTGRTSLCSPGWESIFSEPQLVPVCNSSDRFGLRAAWGNNDQKLTVNIPDQFDKDLHAFRRIYIKEHPWMDANRGELVRNLVHAYFLGNLYMYNNLKTI